MSKEFDTANKLMEATLDVKVVNDADVGGEVVASQGNLPWLFPVDGIILMSDAGVKYSLKVANGGGGITITQV